MIHLVLMIQESYHLYGLSEFASSFFEEEEKKPTVTATKICLK